MTAAEADELGDPNEVSPSHVRGLSAFLDDHQIHDGLPPTPAAIQPPPLPPPASGAAAAHLEGVQEEETMLLPQPSSFTLASMQRNSSIAGRGSVDAGSQGMGSGFLPMPPMSQGGVLALSMYPREGSISSLEVNGVAHVGLGNGAATQGAAQGAQAVRVLGPGPVAEGLLQEGGLPDGEGTGAQALPQQLHQAGYAQPSSNGVHAELHAQQQGEVAAAAAQAQAEADQQAQKKGGEDQQEDGEDGQRDASMRLNGLRYSSVLRVHLSPMKSRSGKTFGGAEDGFADASSSTGSGVGAASKGPSPAILQTAYVATQVAKIEAGGAVAGSSNGTNPGMYAGTGAAGTMPASNSGPRSASRSLNFGAEAQQAQLFLQQQQQSPQQQHSPNGHHPNGAADDDKPAAGRLSPHGMGNWAPSPTFNLQDELRDSFGGREGAGAGGGAAPDGGPSPEALDGVPLEPLDDGRPRHRSLKEVAGFVWRESKAATRPALLWAFLRLGLPGG